MTSKKNVLTLNMQDFRLPYKSNFKNAEHVLNLIKQEISKLDGEEVKVNGVSYYKFKRHIRITIKDYYFVRSSYIIDAISFYIVHPTGMMLHLSNKTATVESIEKVLIALGVGVYDNPIVIIEDDLSNLYRAHFNSEFTLREISDKEYDRYIAKKVLEKMFGGKR